MKIGVLSDAHGNKPFFEQCITRLLSENVDTIYYLGDFVGYYPDGDSVISELRILKAHCLMGNHDAMLLGLLPLDEEKERVYQLRNSSLSKSNLQFLSKLLPYQVLTIEDMKILFVHGNPWNPLNGYTYPDSDLEMFSNLHYNYIFMGHTHIPFSSVLPNLSTLTNVGSCGLPRDIGNTGSYAILDTAANRLDLRRVSVDTAPIKERYSSFVHSSVIECLDRVL